MLPTKSVFEAFKAESYNSFIIEPKFDALHQNEMLMFVKPEIFMASDVELVAKRLEFIFQALSDFQVSISGMKFVSAEKLEAARTIDSHYGFINTISRTASKMMSTDEIAEIRSKAGSGENTPVYGGHEFLEMKPTLNATTLDNIWATKKSIKIKSGLYVQSYNVDGEDVVLVNGFHPLQIEHFTTKGRVILIMTLASDLPWRFLRARMLGDTFPEKAVQSSIRGQLHHNAAAYGFDSVTIANNCVHMSAGPFEAAAEFRNFYGDVLSEAVLNNIAITKRLQIIGAPPISELLSNPSTKLGSSDSTLFDATEEVDMHASCAIAKVFFS